MTTEIPVGQRHPGRDPTDARVGVDVADAEYRERVDLELGREGCNKQPTPVLALVCGIARVTATRPDVGGYGLLSGDDVVLTAAADHDAVDTADADDLAES